MSFRQDLSHNQGLWSQVFDRARSLLQIQVLSRLKSKSLQRFVSLFLIGASLSIAIAACAPNLNQTSTEKPERVSLTLVSYAVTKAAYSKIIPKFAAQWKQTHNQDIKFKQSYGPSGAQTRAVIDGLDADVVALALALDTQKLEKAGLLQSGWETKAPNNAIVTQSVGVLVIHDGNPKGIQAWADLAKEGVQVITANPKTSGGARWNFLGIWGSALKTGGSEAQALAFTTKVFKNIPVLPRDAREATDVFYKQGQGDVLITYENEAILAAQRGQKLSYVVPEVNIAIDSPIAVVDKNVDKHKNREVAEAFVRFLFTPEAQREFAKVGFRPVDPTVEKEVTAQFPKIKTLFNVKDLGGWTSVQEKFFSDGAIFDQIQAKS